MKTMEQTQIDMEYQRVTGWIPVEVAQPRWGETVLVVEGRPGDRHVFPAKWDGREFLTVGEQPVRATYWQEMPAPPHVEYDPAREMPTRQERARDALTEALGAIFSLRAYLEGDDRLRAIEVREEILQWSQGWEWPE